MSEHNDGESEYTPIACATYSEYEVAILHHERLRLHWRDESGLDHLEVIEPVDLQTRDHAEFMQVRRNSGEVFGIRLDHIHRAEIPGQTVILSP